MESLAGSGPSPRAKRVALCLAAALAVATACALPVAHAQLPASSAFLTIFLTLAAASDALTAFLLFGQARLGRSLPLLVLAGGYVYSALAIVAHAAMFPGVFAPAGLFGGSQSAVWFWVWWHGGFPLFVVAYALSARRRDPLAGRPVPASLAIAVGMAIVALVIALAVVTVSRQAALPTLIAVDRYGGLIATGIGPLVMLAIVAALAALVRATRLRTVTDVWLAVALFSSLLDCTLTLVAGSRFTAGWYVARVESLCTSTVVLLAFLGAIDRILTRLARLSRIDGLTGVGNRRAFDEDFARACVAGARANRPVALLMLDVDCFKSYNDAYGHQAGDEVLRTVATCISKSLARRTDSVARYGGEEFAVVLPATGDAGAAKVAERIRALLMRRAIPHAAARDGVITLSIGASAAGGAVLRERDAMPALVARADAALYRAKDTGRNRVVVSERRGADVVPLGVAG